MGKRSKRGSLRFLHPALPVLSIVLGLVLAVMIATTVFFQRMVDRIQYIPKEEPPALSQQVPDTLPVPEAPSPDPLVPEELSFTLPDPHPERNVIRLLLIGQDRREGEARARSDSMILCTFRKDTNELILTSILRDLYVPIPGYRDNRLNAAYAFGGIELLEETLEHNFGIRPDGSLEVDFTRFSGIVDLLGGVRLTLREDEARFLNELHGFGLSAGENLLTGEQALHYTRIRSLDPDGDFSRTNRQRTVITAMVQACREAGLITLLSVLEEILPMVTTDLSRRELISLAGELFPMLSDLTIVSQRLPADGTYTNKTIRGMAVLVADLDAARRLLEETLTGTSG